MTDDIWMKTMRVDGLEVDLSIIKQHWDAWIETLPNYSETLFQSIMQCGYGVSTTYGAADLLRQRARKANLIHYRRGLWHKGPKPNNNGSDAE